LLFYGEVSVDQFAVQSFVFLISVLPFSWHVDWVNLFKREMCICGDIVVVSVVEFK
jgi:hypothetical protein